MQHSQNAALSRHSQSSLSRCNTIENNQTLLALTLITPTRATRMSLTQTPAVRGSKLIHIVQNDSTRPDTDIGYITAGHPYTLDPGLTQWHWLANLVNTHNISQQYRPNLDSGHSKIILLLQYSFDKTMNKWMNEWILPPIFTNKFQNLAMSYSMTYRNRKRWLNHRL